MLGVSARVELFRALGERREDVVERGVAARTAHHRRQLERFAEDAAEVARRRGLRGHADVLHDRDPRSHLGRHLERGRWRRRQLDHGARDAQAPGASCREQRVLVTDRHLERRVRLPGTQPTLVGIGLVTQPTLRGERFDPVDGPAHARERIRETWEPSPGRRHWRAEPFSPLRGLLLSSRTCSGTSRELRSPRGSCRRGARPRR